MLSSCRSKAGMTLAQVEQASSVPMTNLSAYERGLKTPTLAVLYRLATAYGVEVGELLPLVEHVNLPAEDDESLDTVEPTPRVTSKRK